MGADKFETGGVLYRLGHKAPLNYFLIPAPGEGGLTSRSVMLHSLPGDANKRVIPLLLHAGKRWTDAWNAFRVAAIEEAEGAPSRAAIAYASQNLPLGPCGIRLLARMQRRAPSCPGATAPHAGVHPVLRRLKLKETRSIQRSSIEARPHGRQGWDAVAAYRMQPQR